MASLTPALMALLYDRRSSCRHAPPPPFPAMCALTAGRPDCGRRWRARPPGHYDGDIGEEQSPAGAHGSAADTSDVRARRLELVADPANRADKLRLGWVIPDLLAQMGDVDVHQPGISQVTVAPDRFQQFLAGVDPALGCSRARAESRIRCWSVRSHGPRHAPPGPRVDGDAPEVERLLLLIRVRGSRAAKDRLHAGDPELGLRG